MYANFTECQHTWAISCFAVAGSQRAGSSFVCKRLAGELTHLPIRTLEVRLQVIATPYSTSFDRTRIADEVQFKFDRCF